MVSIIDGNRFLADQDPEIHDLVEREKNRQWKGLELIASEVCAYRVHDCWLGSSARVVRVMPNTPCLVGELAAAYAPNAACSAADAATAGSLRRGRRGCKVTNG